MILGIPLWVMILLAISAGVIYFLIAKNEKSDKKVTVRVLGSGTAPKGMKLSDFDSVQHGLMQAIDGIILLASGFFRILAFAVLIVVDGLKTLWKGKEKKREYYEVKKRKVKN